MILQGAIRAEFDLEELPTTAESLGDLWGSGARLSSEAEGLTLSPIWFDGDERMTPAQQVTVERAILQRLACRVDLRLLASLLLYQDRGSVHAVGVLQERQDVAGRCVCGSSATAVTRTSATNWAG